MTTKLTQLLAALTALLLLAACGGDTTPQDLTDTGLPVQLEEIFDQLDTQRNTVQSYVRIIAEQSFTGTGSAQNRLRSEQLYEALRAEVNDWITAQQNLISSGDFSEAAIAALDPRVTRISERYGDYVNFAEQALGTGDGEQRFLGVVGPLFNLGQMLFDYHQQQREQELNAILDALEEKKWDPVGQI